MLPASSMGSFTVDAWSHSILTWKSLPAVKWKLIKPTHRPSVSLVTESVIFLWMSNHFISGGPFITSAVFFSSLLLPPFVGGGGRLVSESVGKAGLLSDYLDSKHSRESVDLPLTCHPSPSLTTFSFRSSEVRHLLLELDLYGGIETLRCFLFFLRELLMLWPPALL